MAKKKSRKRRQPTGGPKKFSEPVSVPLAHGRGQRVLTFVYLFGGGLALLLSVNIVIESLTSIGEVADDGSEITAGQVIPVAAVFAVMGFFMFRLLYLPAFRAARRRGPVVTFDNDGIELVDNSLLAGKAQIARDNVTDVRVGEGVIEEFAEIVRDWRWKAVPDQAQFTPFAQRPNAYVQLDEPVELAGARNTRALGARWPIRPPRRGHEVQRIWFCLADPDEAAPVIERWTAAALS